MNHKAEHTYVPAFLLLLNHLTCGLCGQIDFSKTKPIFRVLKAESTIASKIKANQTQPLTPQVSSLKTGFVQTNPILEPSSPRWALWQRKFPINNRQSSFVNPFSHPEEFLNFAFCTLIFAIVFLKNKPNFPRSQSRINDRFKKQSQFKPSTPIPIFLHSYIPQRLRPTAHPICTNEPNFNPQLPRAVGML